ncbi:NO-inducible flavohemoprotein [Acetobacteraceae bacterium]|nr:NO-inducible flavohemoprotein [Acetobacteraceae bacterium]
MPKPLSQKTIEIVTACIPALEVHGIDIAKETYKNLLADKEIADLFNLSHQKDGSQPKSLATALLVYAQHIQDPSALKSMIERIAEKHVSLNIYKEHYDYVAKAIIKALKIVLGDKATKEILDAWGEAYWFLADVLIEREAEIYTEHAQQQGGWRGWRQFKVAEIKQECEDMKSFKLLPVDGKPVLKHKPGQYLGLKLEIEGHGSQRRNYSISSTPNEEFYRLTIRTVKDGVVSEWFNHSVKEGVIFELSDPSGDFTLQHSDAPIALISGGSGLTPMISMVGALAAQSSVEKLRYIHSTRTQETEAFGEHIRKLAGEGKLTADIFYTKGEKSPEAENVNTYEGRVSEAFFKDAIPANAICYICGPKDFTLAVIKALKAQGLKQEQLRYELFGSITDAELAVS